MRAYQTKTNKLPGTSYSEVRKRAELVLNKIKKQSKRKPYVRSAYFNKQKVFFDHFWSHLGQKSPRERYSRLKYFDAAIDLIKNSHNHPTSIESPHTKREILHRFAGLTKDKELFYVQIKQDKRTGSKYFMSCFPQE